MKKIDLSPYEFAMGKEIEPLIVDVADEIAKILLNTQLNLNGPDLLKNNKLSEKIRDEEKDYILLEDAEYNIIENAVKTIKGFPESYVEVMKRILEAKDFDINEISEGDAPPEES